MFTHHSGKNLFEDTPVFWKTFGWGRIRWPGPQRGRCFLTKISGGYRSGEKLQIHLKVVYVSGLCYTILVVGYWTHQKVCAFDSLRTSRCFKDIVIVAIEYEDIAWLP